MLRVPVIVVLLALPGIASQPAAAQSVLFDEVHTVATPASAQPVEKAFVTQTAGNYEVVLTDLGAPAAPLAEVRLAVTRGSVVVGTPINAAGTLTFPATAGGNYVVRLTGRPGSTLGSGLVRIVVRPAGSSTNIENFVAILALPPGIPTANQFLVDQPLTIGTTGNYDVVLRDLQWPQGLTTLLLAVVEEGGPLVTALAGGAPTPAQVTVLLDASRQYRVFVVAEAPSPEAGGVYSIGVRQTGGGAVALDRTVGVAGVVHLGSFNLNAGGYTLRLTDLEFPAALVTQSALLTLNGISAAATSTPGDTLVTATAGAHELYAHATPAATPGAGSQSIEIVAQGQTVPAFSLASAFVTQASGISGYVYPAGLGAGAMRLRLADYQFPEAFALLRLALIQGHELIGTPFTTPGSQDLTTTTAPIYLLAFARPGTQGGLLGVDLASTAAGGNTLFETTQGVGRTFEARKISVNGNTRYDVSLADLGFPANFANLAAAVTRGTDRIGFIFGTGTFDFAATPGNYFLNFIAQPDATENAGTYSITVAERPPAPAVILMASAARVASGGTIDLTWNVTQATGCTASGGWNGSRALSGTERSAAISARTTFTLTCTGAGGDTVQSVDVDVVVASGPPGGGGGGGALGAEILLLLALAAGAAARASRGRRGS